ncbi:MAG: DUF1800 family protein [Bosea sp.]|uniref:DUF1800 domain-containing protein n=1 Tax=Bosea sp. (in: a-proteobacteria) TaxID=1871050 RepID=UPI001ACD3545|nr:DUF1800 family protein [Bosea sp. (in: a-proteobacteria)]MBN9451840.1 DUF1800 family protein [Bosea sp. (in: a-proteobacteria)]
MAGSGELTAGAVALQRFGLGPKPGQGEVFRAQIREKLLAEIAAGGVAQPAGVPFSGTVEIGKALFAFEDQEKREREARRIASATHAQASQQGSPQAMEMVGAAPQAQPAGPQNQMAPAKPPNEPALPYRTYRDEVKSRVDLALAAETGFSERLVMFWSNHFCIGATKSTIGRIMAGAYEREAIRPHVFGRFEDMLIAAESHPAMLDFLDNRQSIGPNSPAGRRQGRGLNENLAREIMELHTLGVSGGYSQGDVTNLARILTGWTMAGRDGRLGFPGSFIFNPGQHEPGVTPLLGRDYAQPDLAQGVAALTDLARQPATAHFIATKLVRHFVADDPTPPLVEALAATFRDSGGDLGAVYRALIGNDAAWMAPATKIRSPQEFMLASYRALGRKPDFGQIIGPVGVMGQPFWQPSGPNGYADSNAAWGSAEGLKTRVDVAAGWGRQAAGSVADPRVLADDILGPLLSPETKQAVARAESKPQAIALLLMSPEFQRR